MATHVQVILRQDVDKLGAAGELVRVKPGFARNFLLPRGIAALATGENVKQIEHERRMAMANAEKQRKLAEGTAAQIEGLSIELAVQAGEGGRLYGSVTSRDVADVLASKGVTVDRKKLVLPDSIKSLGDYEISAKLGHEVNAKFKLIVTPKAS
jgi:large subunit ribosomal protein L9